ncbi:MAG: hypothetical protein K0U78_02750 [Actinomycetia bacterium]|nr:hypothetical protein [Actinomycetes bacterium]
MERLKELSKKVDITELTNDRDENLLEHYTMIGATKQFDFLFGLKFVKMSRLLLFAVNSKNKHITDKCAWNVLKYVDQDNALALTIKHELFSNLNPTLIEHRIKYMNNSIMETCKKPLATFLQNEPLFGMKLKDCVDDQGNNCLTFANDLNVVKYLLSQKVDPWQLNKFGQLAMFEMSMKKYAECVHICLLKRHPKTLEQCLKFIQMCSYNATMPYVAYLLKSFQTKSNWNFSKTQTNPISTPTVIYI